MHMKFTKSQELRLLYSSAEFNSRYKTRIIDMQKETSHIHKDLSRGNFVAQNSFLYVYCTKSENREEIQCLFNLNNLCTSIIYLTTSQDDSANN